MSDEELWPSEIPDLRPTHYGREPDWTLLRYMLSWPNPIFEPVEPPEVLVAAGRARESVGDRVYPIDPDKAIPQFPRYPMHHYPALRRLISEDS
jgi:hypothetical protein